MIQLIKYLLTTINQALSYILIKCIRGYQIALSPIMGNQCRFTPTCSHYGIEAIKIHGAIKGSLLTLWRILRCNPFSKGGEDPVPLKKNITCSHADKISIDHSTHDELNNS